MEYANSAPKGYISFRCHCQYIKPSRVASLICSSNSFDKCCWPLKLQIRTRTPKFEFNTLTPLCRCRCHCHWRCHCWAAYKAVNRWAIAGRTDSISTLLFWLPLFLTALSNGARYKSVTNLSFERDRDPNDRHLATGDRTHNCNWQSRDKSSVIPWNGGAIIVSATTQFEQKLMCRHEHIRYCPMTSRSSPRATNIDLG